MSSLFQSFQLSDDDIAADPQLNGSPSSSSECVQDEFSALGETLSRQFRGVANFFAPQPSPAVVFAAESSDSSPDSSSPSPRLQGVRNDLAEIGGGLRSGFAMLSVSSNKAVGEISRFASNLLLFRRRSDGVEEHEEFEDEFVDDTLGITDEVLNFVTEISSRPECWTDFPLALDDTDFKMSDVQEMHTSTIQKLIPNISALKIQLQSFMSNEIFWMIYFILLLPRFNQDDLQLLATPEIVETRNQLLKKFQRKEKLPVTSEDTCDNNSVCCIQKENIAYEEKTNLSQIIEGLKIQDGNGENANQRLKMEDLEICRDGKERGEGLEGISLLSDIVENDDGAEFSGRFSVTNPQRTSSSTESSDWVQLHENLGSKLDHQKTGKQDRDSECGDSSDWFNVDEFD